MAVDFKRNWPFLDPEALARLARLELRPRGPVEGSYAGRHKSPHRGSSIEFDQYRKYVPGDDIKNIDWAIYAKTDRFYIKEFEADTNLRCHLAVDCTGSMGFQGEFGSKYAWAQRTCALLSQLVVQQGDAIGLSCFGEAIKTDLPARNSAKHLGHLFTTLNDIEPKGEGDIAQALHDLAERIPRRGMVIVFSDFFTDVEPLLDSFEHLRYRKHDVVAFHILNDVEIEFNFDRPTRFEDVETGDGLVSDPSLIRESYQLALTDYLKSLKEGCLQHNVDYRRAQCSDAPDEILSQFLLERMRF